MHNENICLIKTDRYVRGSEFFFSFSFFPRTQILRSDGFPDGMCPVLKKNTLQI